MNAAGAAIVMVGLAACGQRGALYLPTDPAAKDRATLPGLLLPGSSSTTAPASSTAPASTASPSSPATAAQPPAAAGSAPAGAAK